MVKHQPIVLEYGLVVRGNWQTDPLVPAVSVKLVLGVAFLAWSQRLQVSS